MTTDEARATVQECQAAIRGGQVGAAELSRVISALAGVVNDLAGQLDAHPTVPPEHAPEAKPHGKTKK